MEVIREQLEWSNLRRSDECQDEAFHFTADQFYKDHRCLLGGDTSYDSIKGIDTDDRGRVSLRYS